MAVGTIFREKAIWCTMLQSCDSQCVGAGKKVEWCGSACTHTKGSRKQLPKRCFVCTRGSPAVLLQDLQSPESSCLIWYKLKVWGKHIKSCRTKREDLRVASFFYICTFRVESLQNIGVAAQMTRITWILTTGHASWHTRELKSKPSGKH